MGLEKLNAHNMSKMVKTRLSRNLYSHLSFFFAI